MVQTFGRVFEGVELGGAGVVVHQREGVDGGFERLFAELRDAERQVKPFEKSLALATC